jgi:SAM-dependent methyltransferase
MKEIVNIVNSAPPEAKRYTRHIDRLGAIIQYSYYTSLVHQFVGNQNSVIVDCGGQYGHVTKLLTKFFPNVECYLPDYNEYFTDYWHQRLSIKRVKYGNSYRTIDYCDNYADVVLLSGVLEHTHEQGISKQNALMEIRRILKPNGMLFIWNLPCQYGFVELINIALGRWHHERRFRKEEVIALLQNSDFEICAIDHHELMNMMTRNMLGKIIGHYNAFICDYFLSKLPIVNLIVQHFTVIAKKALQ